MTTSTLARRGNFVIDTDPQRLQIDVIHAYLSQRSYWAVGRPIEVVRRSIAGSLNFGLYDGDAQVGFARVVTDHATFAWLCDVFVLESHRGQGLGKFLIESVMQHPELKSIRRIMLITRDAHELYRVYAGFTNFENPQNVMHRFNPDGVPRG